MIDTKKLKGAITGAGYTQQKIADELGISLNSLNAKVNNHREFKSREIEKLIDILSLRPASVVNQIFFAKR